MRLGYSRQLCFDHERKPISVTASIRRVLYRKPPLSAPGLRHGGEKGVPFLGLGLGFSLFLDFSNDSS